MPTTEHVFRRVEQQLDVALVAAKGVLAAQGVAANDESIRSYHYKADHLCWQQSFTREVNAGLHVAQVNVRITYLEPVEPGEPEHVRVFTRAQLFRVSQESTKDEKSEQTISLPELLHKGIASVVLERLQHGDRLLGQAL